MVQLGYPRASLIWLALVLICLDGCNSAESTTVSAPTASTDHALASPTIRTSSHADAADSYGLLKSCLNTLESIESYHFETNDTGSGRSVKLSEGDFQAPDRIRLTTSVGGGDNLDLLVIGKRPNDLGRSPPGMKMDVC